MNPEIGDIIDCRKTPLGHFVLTLGIKTKQNKMEVMYYMIYSRVYAVFPSIINFFNDCISSKYERFFVAFSKEKGKDKITPYGKLCDVFFLDMESHYKGCLDVDSMIVVNKNPETIDIETLNQWRSNYKVVHRSRLEGGDFIKFMEMIKLSPHINGENVAYICKNYKEYKKSIIRNQKSGP
jgi:hypothetical protein